MENKNGKRFYKKWWFYFIIIIFILCIGTGSYFYIIHAPGKMSEKNFDKKVSVNKNGTVDIKDKSNAQVKVRDESKIYDEIHKMANSKIIAEDNKIWGQIEITPEICNNLIVELGYSNYSDRDTLIKWLLQWKNKDYSNSVEVHNYVWTKLNGNIGRATELKK